MDGGSRIVRAHVICARAMGSQSGPVWQALVTEMAPTHLRGSVLGLVGTVTGLLSAPASLVGGYLYENYSPQSPFFTSFLLGMMGLIIFTVFVKEPDATAIYTS